MIALALAAPMLGACGNDGVDASRPTAPTAPTAQTAPAATVTPVANAGLAQSVPQGATVVLDGRGSRDFVSTALRYRWTLSSRPVGSAATLVSADTAEPSIVTDVPGIYVATLTVNDGEHDSAPASVALAASPYTPPAIEIVDQLEPVSGPVAFRLSDTPAAGLVSWTVDLVTLGNGNAVTWDSTSTSDGIHVVVARIAVAPNAFVELRREITFARTPIGLAVSVAGTRPNVRIDALPTSPNGIASVSAVLDGTTPLGTPTTQADCRSADGACVAAGVYAFVLDGARAGSGDHRVTIRVVDGGGNARTGTVTVSVLNAPAVAIVAPVDGAFVRGTLDTQAVVTSDKPGPVTTTVTFRDVTLLTSTDSRIAARIDLSGVAPGTYTLMVRSIDEAGLATTATRAVVVVSTDALAYTPSFSIGSGGQLLAVDGDRVLYRADNASVRLRDTAVGTEVVLAGTSLLAATTDWQIAGSGVVATAAANDCWMNGRCVYRWDAVTGAIENLSLRDTASAFVKQSHPVAHGNTIVWVDTPRPSEPAGGFTFFEPFASGFTLYDASARTYRTVKGYPLADVVEGDRFDFTFDAGVVDLVYTGHAGAIDLTYPGHVYHWNSASDLSPQLSGMYQNAFDAATDGVTAAWLEVPDGASVPSLLRCALPACASRTVVATQASGFLLRDGVIAYRAGAANSRTLRATDGTNEALLTTSDTLHDVAAGRVVYANGPKFQAWKAANGTTSVVVDDLPLDAKLSGSTLYFTHGATRELYKVGLR